MVVTATPIRARSLSDTLALAKAAADAVGVTRLADLTGLDRTGVPVFQAVRPLSRSLSVSQGKGLTRQSAMVSALLESVESAVAETLPRPSAAACNVPDAWLARHGGGDPDLSVVAGRDLWTGAPGWLAWEQVCLDFTRAKPAHWRPTSIGLAMGNTVDEAVFAALGEHVEHVGNADWRAASRDARARTRIDLQTIDDPVVAALLRRIAAAGLDAALWFSGGKTGIASFVCVLSDTLARTSFAPVRGSGCHTDRATAALRAILEAVQTRVTMIAGAREDIAPTIFSEAIASRRALATLIAPGPVQAAWQDVPTVERGDWGALVAHMLAALAAAGEHSPLVAAILPSPVEGLAIVKVAAPAIVPAGAAGAGQGVASEPVRRAPAIVVRESRPIVFAGPTLSGHPLSPVWERRPPAVAGDLARLARCPPPFVVLIDGCFETVAAVWHKEIVHLLELGVPVFGGGSLGAIRAAELARHGMRGHGRIFEAYRSGAITRDDAVMVSHAPAELGFTPVSIALVDAEASIRQAGLAAQDERALLRVVRTLNFRRRSWPVVQRLIEARSGQDWAERIGAVSRQALSLKRQDALGLIAQLEATPPAALEHGRVACPRTAFYLGLLARSAPAETPSAAAERGKDRDPVAVAERL